MPQAVDTYLEADSDTSATARHLHVQRSTVHWRLQRAAGIVGLDLADSAARLNLRLALKFAALLPTDRRQATPPGPRH